MLKIKISSSLTVFYKKIFPPIWIGGYGIGTIYLWYRSLIDHNSISFQPEAKWFFLLSWILGSGFIIWFARRLKYVWIENTHLIVQSAGQKYVIPFNKIEDVTETRFWNPEMIKLKLISPSYLGDEIVFMAPLVIQIPFADHPTVLDLKERIQKLKQ